MTIYINTLEIKSFNFSAGECQISLPDLDVGPQTEIHADLFNSDSVMQLFLTVDAIRRCNPTTKINLTLPYFPYARQDRVCVPGEALGVHVMADLINRLKCDSVTIYDPHSDVVGALINNVKVWPITKIIINSPLLKKIKKERLTLVSPDAGAEKKLFALASKLKNYFPEVELHCATKHRDLETGNITATSIHADLSNKECIIIDDICDGGRTFIELAKIMREQGAKKIYLYVTHGIFSKGLDELKSHIDCIYCYHLVGNYINKNNKFITILEENTHEH